MKGKTSLLVLVVALLSCLLVQTAAATPKEDAAREATERGTAAYNLGRYADAAKHYEEAYTLIQDANLLFNVGQSYRMAGNSRNALVAYRSFLRTADPDAPGRAQAEKRIRELESAAQSQVEIESVRAEPPPAVPDVAKGEAAPVPVPPVVPAPKPGPSVADINLQTAPGAEPEPAGARFTRTWLAAAVTGAVGIGATVAGLLANSAFHDLENGCGKTGGCSDAAIDGHRSKALIANVLWGAAAAGALTTGALFYLDARTQTATLALRGNF